MIVLCPMQDLNLGPSRIAVFEGCKAIALTAQSLRLDLMSVVYISAAKIVCELCGKAYKNYLLLHSHKAKKHKAKTLYHCDECNKVIWQRGNLPSSSGNNAFQIFSFIK